LTKFLKKIVKYIKPSRMTPNTMPLTASTLSDLVAAQPPLAAAGNASRFGRRHPEIS